MMCIKLWYRILCMAEFIVPPWLSVLPFGIRCLGPQRHVKSMFPWCIHSHCALVLPAGTHCMTVCVAWWKIVRNSNSCALLWGLAHSKIPTSNFWQSLCNVCSSLLTVLTDCRATIPTFLRTKKKLEIISQKTLAHCHPLCRGLLQSLNKRFGEYLCLSDNVSEYIIASIAHPFFKLRWVPSDHVGHVRDLVFDQGCGRKWHLGWWGCTY